VVALNRSTHRTTDEDGAALVETALVLLLVLTITFGIIEWGLYFKDTLSVSSATRTGARTASARPRDSLYATDTVAAVATAVSALDRNGPKDLWIYRADANGMPDSGNFVTCTTCRRFRWDATNKEWDEVSGSDINDWPPLSQHACGGAQSDAVGIFLRAEHEFVTGFFGETRLMEDHTVMKFEPVRGQCS
jgi:hypothetical protein